MIFKNNKKLSRNFYSKKYFLILSILYFFRENKTVKYLLKNINVIDHLIIFKKKYSEQVLV